MTMTLRKSRNFHDDVGCSVMVMVRIEEEEALKVF